MIRTSAITKTQYNIFIVFVLNLTKHKNPYTNKMKIKVKSAVRELVINTKNNNAIQQMSENNILLFDFISDPSKNPKIK